MTTGPEAVGLLHQQIITRQRTTERSLLEIHDPSVVRNMLLGTAEQPGLIKPEHPDRELITKAADFAEKAFEGRFRRKGSRRGEQIPDVVHAYRVAIRLAEVGVLDGSSLATALLHDVLEDTNITQQDLKNVFREQFGEDISGEIVNGVTLLSRNINTGKKMSDEDYYKQLKGAPHWVQLIKVADRIDNLASFDIMELGDVFKVKGKDTILVIDSFQSNLDETTDEHYGPLIETNPELGHRLQRVMTTGRRHIADYLAASKESKKNKKQTKKASVA